MQKQVKADRDVTVSRAKRHVPDLGSDIPPATVARVDEMATGEVTGPNEETGKKDSDGGRD